MRIETVLPMLVGTGRFELPTCRLGGGRSIHLSYVPLMFARLFAGPVPLRAARPIVARAVAAASPRAGAGRISAALPHAR